MSKAKTVDDMLDNYAETVSFYVDPGAEEPYGEPNYGQDEFKQDIIDAIKRANPEELYHLEEVSNLYARGWSDGAENFKDNLLRELGLE